MNSHTTELQAFDDANQGARLAMEYFCWDQCGGLKSINGAADGLFAPIQQGTSGDVKPVQ